MIFWNILHMRAKKVQMVSVLTAHMHMKYGSECSGKSAQACLSLHL